MTPRRLPRTQAAPPQHLLLSRPLLRRQLQLLRDQRVAQQVAQGQRRQEVHARPHHLLLPQVRQGQQGGTA